jgi:cell division protein YceG involved in septum cleavage
MIWFITMANKSQTKNYPNSSWLFILAAVLLLLGFSAFGYLHLGTILQETMEPITVTPVVVEDVATLPKPFPVGVDRERKLIVENIDVDQYISNQIASNHYRPNRRSWLARVTAAITRSAFYQQLASPISRTLVVLSGERKEEVIDNIGDILRWDTSERLVFETLVSSSTPAIDDGKFFPGSYLVAKDATPEDVAKLINDKLTQEVLLRYSDEVEKAVPFEQALIIASLLEREAYDFEDMRYISGVIWNRLFIDMNLQIDATLQYVKGSQSNQPWWPPVVPKDKYLNSPYNTYENSGLPPTPIANPSVDAILAALNPRATDCYFYFHDQDGGFYCSKTYEEHVESLKKVYGQGR